MLKTIKKKRKEKYFDVTKRFKINIVLLIELNNNSYLKMNIKFHSCAV
jgi:hypothetical protein